MAEGQQLRLLLVEDSEADAELLRLELRRGGFAVQCKRVDTERDLDAALAAEWDLIISDYHMPRFDGLRAFAMCKARCAHVPFIFVSGALGEERAVAAMRAGARDYLLKTGLGRLCAVVQRELDIARQHRTVHAAEMMAQREHERLGLALDASRASVVEFVPADAAHAYVDPRLFSVLGYAEAEQPPPDMNAQWFLERLHPAEAAEVRTAAHDLVAGRRDRLSLSLRLLHRHGHWVPMTGHAEVVSHAPDGTPARLVGVLLDASEIRALEGQLRQAQKMEAVGRLAGGVAHDFNNILTAILAFSESAAHEIGAESPAAEDMQEIIRASERAASLTRQLLTFSRTGAGEVRAFDVNEVVAELTRMLERVIGNERRLLATLDAEPARVMADPTGVEQVLMNLVVNARDATEAGDEVRVHTERVAVTPTAGAPDAPELGPGHFVVIDVRDCGSGMDEDTVHRIFDPFFTTKREGVGTGLGLATCYGIVQQAGGAIGVVSRPGQGTVFRVYLPAADEAQPSDDRPTLRPPATPATGTVLLSEPNAKVRRVLANHLAQVGYEVLASADADEALGIAQQRGKEIAVWVVDPALPGLEAAGRRLRALLPHVSVLSIPARQAAGSDEEGTALGGAVVRKPFAPSLLVQCVREVLAAAPSVAPPVASGADHP